MADKNHGMPEAVVRTTDELYAINGRLARGVNITVTPEIFEQYRTGYRCLACHHFPQREAFPAECCEPYCRFGMRREQLELLAFEDRGEIDLWPTRAGEAIDVHDDSIWLPGQPHD